MLQEGLYTLLANTSSIVALLGSPSSRADGTTGIFPVQIPEATPLPPIALPLIAGDGIVVMEGASALRTSRIQFSCYGRGFAQSKQLSQALWNLLEGLHTTLAEGTEVDVATVLIISDAFEEAPFIYHTPVDVEFKFREPAPV